MLCKRGCKIPFTEDHFKFSVHNVVQDTGNIDLETLDPSMTSVPVAGAGVFFPF